MRYWILTAASVALLTGCAAPRETVDSAPARAGDPPQESTDFTFRAGDELTVNVWRHDDLGGSVRVDPVGNIYLPVAGEIQAAGLSVRELRDAVSTRLLRYVRDPRVQINVTRLRSNAVYVLGEVRSPGAVEMDSPLRAWEAVARVGGLTTDANARRVILIRLDSAGEATGSVLNMDLRSAPGKNELSAACMVARGDVLYVPPKLIADVERFMARVNGIVSPIMNLERAIIYGDELDAIFGPSESERQRGVVISP